MKKISKNKSEWGRFLKIDQLGNIRESVDGFIKVNAPPKKETEIVKFWDREYSVFTLSTLVKMLEVMNHKEFGNNSFSSFVFFCHKGASQHFRSLDESRLFEEVVGKKFIANKSIGDEILKLHTVNGEHLVRLFNEIKKRNEFNSDFITDFGLSFGVFAGANTCIQRSADYVAQYHRHNSLLEKLIKQRTKYEHVMSFYDTYLEKLCAKVAKKKKVSSPRLLKLLTLREFIDFLRTSKLPPHLKERDECCTMFILPEPKLMAGKKAKLLLKRMLMNEEKRNKNLSREKLRGAGIYPGKVKGIVRVITGIKDLASFKKGNILVASTTLPQYNAALTKAIGIITDEGGILTHAAVCSREFKIPGIVGVKIATKTLKNGDMIEMDARNGSIKVIR